MVNFKAFLLLLVGSTSFTMGSQVLTPGVPTLVSRSLVPAASPLLPASVYSAPLVPNILPAAPGVPLVPRSVYSGIPGVVPAGLSPVPGALLPTGYSLPAPFLPAPLVPQARSIHAVAPFDLPAVAPGVPPFAVVR